MHITRKQDSAYPRRGGPPSPQEPHTEPDFLASVGPIGSESAATGFDSSEQLAVGIDEFDAEHRSLMTRLCAISEGIFHRGDRSSLLVMVDLLAIQATAHFETEERLMRVHAFPELAAHIAEHVELLSEVGELQRCLTFGIKPPLLAVPFLKRWLCDHIRHADRRCAEFLRRNGVR